MACDKALDLFAQESYKKRSDYSGGLTGTMDVTPVKSESDGGVAHDGKFYFGYGDTDQYAIYKNLYDKSTGNDRAEAFYAWAETYAHNWYSINALNNYINHNDYPTFPVQTMPVFQNYLAMYSDIDVAFERYEAAMDLYTEYAIAKSYYDNMMTPLNFGVPYVDERTAESMFQWNLGRILSNCSDKLVHRNPVTHQFYVLVDGFKVYFNEADITSIDYKVYDLTDKTSGQLGYGAKGFQHLTGIDPAGLGFVEELEYLGTNDDERQRICVAFVEYAVPVEYEGITPIKRIFNWVWTNEVEGLRGKPGKSPQTWNDTREILTGGGSGLDTTGQLPVPGQLIFYLVR